MKDEEYKPYAVIADSKSLAFVDMRETPEYLIARGGAKYKKGSGMENIANTAVGILAVQKLKVGSHTAYCYVYDVNHPTVIKMHDSQKKAQFKEYTFRTFHANHTKLTYPEALFLNHAFNLGIAEPQLKAEQSKQTYSTQEHDWDYCPSIRDALKLLYDRDQLVSGIVIWGGSLVLEKVTDYTPSGRSIVEDYGNNIVDNFGESADGHDGIAELKDSDYAELERLIEAWFIKKVKPSCGVIENKEEIVVTDDMVDYFLGSYRGGKAR